MASDTLWTKHLYKEFKSKEQATGEFRTLLMVLARTISRTKCRKIKDDIHNSLFKLGKIKYS